MILTRAEINLLSKLVIAELSEPTFDSEIPLLKNILDKLRELK